MKIAYQNFSMIRNPIGSMSFMLSCMRLASSRGMGVGTGVATGARPPPQVVELTFHTCSSE